ncbi:MAG: NAD(P)-dependent oxidoreductase [Acidimicrobiia bacterium]
MADVVVSEFMDRQAVERLEAATSVLYDPDLATDRARLLEAVGEARALVVRNRTQVDADVVAAAPALVVVGRLGVGLDNIDLAACDVAGVAVRPAIGANAAAVAEHVVGALFALARPALGATDRILAGEWPRTEYVGQELAGRRLGLVGLGHTAREVARRADALGMEVAGHDPITSPEGIPNLPLDELLARSQAISVHVPLTEDTRGLLDAARLALLPAGAWLVDTSRGGVVDHAAVGDALRAGRLGGAALDVFADEPPTEAQLAALAGSPNLILTPHVAGITEESNRRIGTVVADAVLEALGP